MNEGDLSEYSRPSPPQLHNQSGGNRNSNVFIDKFDKDFDWIEKPAVLKRQLKLGHNNVISNSRSKFVNTQYIYI